MNVNSKNIKNKKLINNNEKFLVFSYGTLTNKKILKKICNRKIRIVDATLQGYKKVIDDDDYLFIQEDKMNYITGKLLFLTKNDLIKIDQWESVPYYWREEKNVLVNNKKLKAYVYNRDANGEVVEVDSKMISRKAVDEVLQSIKYNPSTCDIFIINIIKEEQWIREIINNHKMTREEKRYFDNFDEKYKKVIEDEINVNKFSVENITTICDKLIIKKHNIEERVYITIRKINNLFFDNYYLIYIELINSSAPSELIVNSFKIENFDFKNHSHLKQMLNNYFYFLNFNKNIDDKTKAKLFLNRDKVLANQVDSNFKDSLNRNIAFYDSAQIFANNNVLIEITKEFHQNYEERLLKQFYTLYIYDYLIIKNFANLIFRGEINDLCITNNEKQITLSINNLEKLEELYFIITTILDVNTFFTLIAAKTLAKKICESMIFNLNFVNDDKLLNSYQFIKNKKMSLMNKKIEKNNKYRNIIISTIVLLLSSDFIVNILSINFKVDVKIANWVLLSIVIILLVFYLFSLFMKKKD